MKKQILQLLLMLTSLSAGEWLFAADTAPPADKPEIDVAGECKRVKNLQPPKTDMPSTREAALLSKCDAQDLYDAAGGNPHADQSDWDKVRHCAIATNDTDVLMMLYANGFGVTPNRDLAVKYACEAERTLYNPENAVSDLVARMGVAGNPQRKIDICDYEWSDTALNICAERERNRANHANEHRYAALETNLSTTQKAAFRRLRRALQDMVRTHDSVRPPWGHGSVSDALSTTAGVRIEEESLHNLEQCEQGALPDYSQGQYAEYEDRLMSVHKKLMQTAAPDPEINMTSVHVVSLKKRERAWLKYRDAWVAYGRVRYPQVPAYAWKAMLTQLRMEELEELDRDLDLIKEM